MEEKNLQLLETSESVKHLFQKLLQFQSKEIEIKKNAANPHFKSKYADLGAHLESIIPLASELGLVIMQFPMGNRFYTRITDAETSEYIQAYMPFNFFATEPQKAGSAITYYRRYMLSSMFNIAAEDDDGNAASGIEEKKVAITKWISVGDNNWKLLVEAAKISKANLELQIANFKEQGIGISNTNLEVVKKNLK